MNATQEQIEKLRTLQESYDELANKVAGLDGVAKETTSQEILEKVQNIDIDTTELAKEATLGTPQAGQPSTIFSAIAQIGQDSKQTIVGAINQMGGSATTDMTWAQLAAQIEELSDPTILDPRIKFVPNIQKPIDLLGILLNNCNGIEEFYSGITETITLAIYVGKFNNTIKKFSIPNVKNISTNSSYGCAMGVACEEVYLDSLEALGGYFFNDKNIPLKKLYCPMVSTFSTRSLMPATLIDFYTGGEFNASVNFVDASYAPSEAYRTDKSSLCFDTDPEEYGQAFSTNWDKWKWCIINHFAANLKDRTGLTAHTITFGSGVLSHFDAEMIAAFTNKNWTLA